MAYQNVSLSNLLGLLRSRLDSYTFWTDAEMTDAINEGLRIYQLATGRWKGRFTFDCVKDRTIYDLTQIPVLQDQTTKKTNILAPFRIVFGTGPQPLAWSSWADLDFTFPGWQMVSTTTPGAPSAPMMGGLFGGLNLIFIFPADGATTGTNQLQVDCLVTTPVLSAPGDFLNLDTSEVQALLGYCAHVLSWKSGGLAFQSSMPGYFAFLNMLADRNGNLKVLSPFKEAMGSDQSRRSVPRRITDATLNAPVIGVR